MFLFECRRGWEKVVIKTKKLAGEVRKARIIEELRVQSGAGAPIDPYLKVKKLTAEVAVLMALIHGEDWWPCVDHDRQVVMVVRRGNLAGSG